MSQIEEIEISAMARQGNNVQVTFAKKLEFWAPLLNVNILLITIVQIDDKYYHIKFQLNWINIVECVSI